MLNQNFSTMVNTRPLIKCYSSEKIAKKSRDKSEMSLRRSLSMKIEAYLSSKSYNTLSKLSQRSLLDYKTIKKIQKSEQKLSNLDPLKLAELAKVIGYTCEIRNFLYDHKSILNSKKIEEYLKLLNLEKKQVNIHFDSTLEFEIFTICSNQCGASIEQIKELAGIEGLSKLEILLEKKIVSLIDGRYYGQQKFECYTKSTAQKYIREFSKKVRLRKRSKDLSNHLSFEHQGLNLKGVMEIERVYKDFQSQLKSLISNPLYQGQNHYFMFFGMDSNIDKTYLN